jgi:hypothetical protein
MATAPPTPRVPLICADPAAVVGAEIFNPNLWSGMSKGIVQSCWTEYSVLHHCSSQIADMCANSESLCQRNVEMLQQQWRTARFDLAKIIVYGQVPGLHMCIESFFAGIKTLLDLLVQLLSSEKIVTGVVDGFHRAQDTYGGKVLNALDNNAPGNRKDVAAKVRDLIVEHKALWIDEAIRARDQLIHPEKGIHQLMFQLDFGAQGDTLVCKRISPPMIGARAIDDYARSALTQAHSFSSNFLNRLQEAGSV